MLRNLRVFSVLLLVLLGAGDARAAAVVQAYVPRVAMPGDVIEIYGTGFGSYRQKHWMHLRYGRGNDMLGLIEPGRIMLWLPHVIRLRLPEDLTPGPYWIALYDSLGKLVSNRTPALNIQRPGGR
ncbi:MAG: hypothetical protein KDG50_00485 [Chromatiales bacterium]|nr:hypothetical protein [Chromatiales bacterium]